MTISPEQIFTVLQIANQFDSVVFQLVFAAVIKNLIDHAGLFFTLKLAIWSCKKVLTFGRANQLCKKL